MSSATAGGGRTFNAAETAPGGSRVARIVDEIRDELGAAELELESYLEGLDERKALVAQLRKALEALDPSSAPPRAKPGPKGKAKATGGPGAGSPTWAQQQGRPSDENLDRVERALAEQQAPTGVEQTFAAMKAAGETVSRDTVRRSIYALRDDGRVRVAGASERGGKLYAVMPVELETIGRAD